LLNILLIIIGYFKTCCKGIVFFVSFENFFLIYFCTFAKKDETS